MSIAQPAKRKIDLWAAYGIHSREAPVRAITVPATLDQFTAERFLPYVGDVFLWRPSGAAPEASMRLLEVERFREQPGLTREPFSLLFVMHDQPPLGRGLHRLVHAEFEACELLLSRVSVPKHEREHPGGMFYEAVFS